MKICFLVGALTLSGGTYVIIQHASYLRLKGYDVTLAIRDKFDSEQTRWHDGLSGLKLLPYSDAFLNQYDLVIATWWKTALDLAKFSAKHYSYFVQSIESRFYPSSDSDRRALIESTYQLPVHYITEATWIKDYLKSRYNQDAELVKNGIRKDLYRPEGKLAQPKAGFRVLVEGPLGVFFKNTAYALRQARLAQIDHLWLLTSSPIFYAYGVSRVFSEVAVTETPEIYRSCDLLLKLSSVEGMFGSPLEMFHCGGTAIVLDVSGADEYIIHGYNSIVIPPDEPGKIAEALKNLQRDPKLLLALKKGALETAANWPSWDESSERFRNWIDDVIFGGREANFEFGQLINRPAQEGTYPFETHKVLHTEQAKLIATLISEAESRYPVDIDAKSFQRESFNDMVKSSLRYLARHAPKNLVHLVKSFEYSLEIAFGGNRIG